MAARAAAAVAANFACLPDDLLAHIFGALSLRKRSLATYKHQAIPLVCRRWRRVVLSPHLLRRITFESIGKAAPAGLSKLDWARSFCSWLVTHAAGHVQDLDLRIGTAFNAQSAEAAFFPEVVAALAACGAAGRLQRLRLSLQHLFDLHLPAALAAALSSLRSLSIDVQEGILTLDAPLTAMSRLEDFRVDVTPALDAGMSLDVAPTASLPPSLTSLHLGGTGWGQEESNALPPQIGQLTRLRQLSLEVLALSPEGFAPLARLGGCLERLRLNWCSWLPPPSTLAALSRLTMLSVDTVGEQREAFDEFEGSIEAVLRALPQLRHLRLSYASSGCHETIPRFPPALSGLCGLTSLWWDIDTTEDATLPDPSGPWLRSLHRLALPSSLIVSNEAGLLASTPLLESLHVLLTPGMPWHDRSLRAAVQHPALACVRVSGHASFEAMPSARVAVQAAGRQHPGMAFTLEEVALFDCGALFDDEACRG
ncbi:hypothetical protein ABPG75_012525 [Micractinium tetrahymenae]